MNIILRYALAFIAAVVVAVADRALGEPFLAGWFACVTWLLLAGLWRPFETEIQGGPA